MSSPPPAWARTTSSASRRTAPFLPIDVLTEPDALALIEQHQPGGRFRDDAERQAALQIVRLLDRFTLAVETAALSRLLPRACLVHRVP